jgi:hypothetical protein
MKLIKRFNMSGCKLGSTPLEHNIKLCNDDETKDVNGLYRRGKFEISHYNQVRYCIFNQYT